MLSFASLFLLLFNILLDYNICNPTSIFSAIEAQLSRSHGDVSRNLVYKMIHCIRTAYMLVVHFLVFKPSSKLILWHVFLSKSFPLSSKTLSPIASPPPPTPGISIVKHFQMDGFSTQEPYILVIYQASLNCAMRKSTKWLITHADEGPGLYLAGRERCAVWELQEDSWECWPPRLHVNHSLPWKPGSTESALGVWSLVGRRVMAPFWSSVLKGHQWSAHRNFSSSESTSLPNLHFY